MGVPTKHVLQQGPVLAALGQTALLALKQHLGHAAPRPVLTPGPEISAVVPPRPRDLVRDYVRKVGGDPGAYKGVLPPHLFPQWGFPLAARTLRGVHYPLARMLNGGCRLEINAPLPADVPLHVSARLEDIDDNGRRAVLRQRIVTGTADTPDALVAYLNAIVPLGGGKDAPKADRKPRPRARVPAGARELAYWKLGAREGLDFALLTGDFNPVHWIPAYARASGFKSTILHGFATMARAIEGLNRTLWSGDVRPLRVFECKFTRPLVLPARVGLYVDDAQGVYVGDAPSGPAYLTGSFETRDA